MFYSASTGGFYVLEIHGNNIPSDAVEITSEYHNELLTGQSNGMVISHDEDGYPILVPAAGPTNDQLAVEARSERDRQLRDIYDRGLNMAKRVRDLSTTTEQTEYAAAKILELHEYAIALQEIPEQPGFPVTIVWPEIPGL